MSVFQGMSARELWKTIYRLKRIARREVSKAAMDMVTYGSGFLRVNANGEAERLDPQNVRMEVGKDMSIKRFEYTTPPRFDKPGECGACPRVFTENAAKNGQALCDTGLCVTCWQKFRG